ncbi:MAG: hypothetical protein A2Y21_12045 [Clostridiales bacterium GWC2_40_7]|nr:MAG: hypothetical protein A2Y21_12045 [Clostridiales bacterium GWC2_40_7]
MNMEELFTLDPRGRSGRCAFLSALVFGLFFIIVAVFVSAMYDLGSLHLSKICVLIFGLWSTIIEIRRLRDIDWSPWWIILFPTPINFILITWLLLAPGVKDFSRTGPDNSTQVRLEPHPIGKTILIVSLIVMGAVVVCVAGILWNS